jgi:hypothetical protein
MANGFVGMLAIYMEEIDTSLGELVGRIVKRCAEEVGEGRIMPPVIGFHFFVDCVAVEASMLVAAPSIDGITFGGTAVFLNRLAKAEIRLAMMRSQLDQEFRSRGRNQVVSEWKMPRPISNPARPVSQWGEQTGIPGRII